jgi:phosphatidylinositol alpha-1,6-mannosyltransferase
MSPIIVLSQIFPPVIGGSGRWLWEIYSRFPKGMARVVTRECDDGAAYDQAHALPVERIPFDYAGWGLTDRGAARRYWAQLWWLRRVMKQHGSREIHTARPLPEGWVAYLGSKMFGWSYTCFVHGEEVCYARGSRELSAMTRRVLNGAQRLVANSESTKQLLIEDWNMDARAVNVLHPGVDTQAYRPADSELARSELGWDGRTVLLTVGRLQRRKGQDTVIRALPRIREHVPDVLYSIVGDGEERDTLERLCDELGVREAVEFRGAPSDDDLLQCYQSCDLFVLANRRDGYDIEGFGIVLLEAQACAKPVVAGLSGGPRETMNAPHTGRTIDATQAENVADVVVEMLASKEELYRVGANARDWTVEQFDWSVQGQRAQDLLLPKTG